MDTAISVGVEESDWEREFGVEGAGKCEGQCALRVGVGRAGEITEVWVSRLRREAEGFELRTSVVRT